MPPIIYPVNTLNCLILENKNDLRFLPHHLHIYFINSKRRFLIYFRKHQHMIEGMRIFNDNSVRFYRRESLIADRQELQEQLYHCNYKMKRLDLRRYLHHSTPYNEPRVHFDKYEKAKQVYEHLQPVQSKKHSEIENNEVQVHIPEEVVVSQKKIDTRFGGYPFKNEEIKQLLENKQLLKAIFASFQFCA